MVHSLIKASHGDAIEPITDPSRLLANPARGDSSYRPPEDPSKAIESYQAPIGLRVQMAVNEG